MLEKIVALSTTLAGLALAFAGCSTANTSSPSGCVASRPAMSGGDTCAVSWACSSNDATYAISCTADSGNWKCSCSTSTETLTTTSRDIIVNTFGCQLTEGAPEAAMQCGWVLQM